jgi:ATP/maltotriose-dependent transcriptional regulator MalT
MALCREFGIDFAFDVSLIYRVFADIGLGAFKEAGTRLRELARRGESHEDADFHVQRRIAELKLDLAQGLHPKPHPLDPRLRAEATRAYACEYDALTALAQVSAGDLARAESLAAETLRATSSAEAVFYARFALEIGRIRQDSGAAAGLASLLRAVEKADVLDAFVVALRAYPALRTRIGDELWTDSLKRAAAHDRRTAPVAAAPAPLTPREAEVLDLLGEGLSNDEIASALVISTATTKVHVHHILKKLGARSRFDAVRRARDLAESAAPR